MTSTLRIFNSQRSRASWVSSKSQLLAKGDTLRIFNSQRLNKVPFREPAGFPVNHNFSQRVIYEFAHDEDDEAIFLTPYMRPSQVLPAIPLSPRDTKEGPLIGFSTWREPKKLVEVPRYPMEEMMLESQSHLPHPEHTMRTNIIDDHSIACVPGRPLNVNVTQYMLNDFRRQENEDS
ncbi:hypothetical protein DFH28DRAFT_1131358 [Melampsora americana]|nr:hypothetical protein DFH28DRAFT_1131358 [Melampsora americana]